MAEQQVSILIDALDRAKDVIQKVQKDLEGISPAADHASKGLNKAKHELTALEEASELAAEKLKEIGKILIAGFAIEKLAELTKETLEAVEQTEFLAQALSTTADTLFRFQQVANANRVSTEQFAISMRELSRKLVEAQDETSLTAQLFRKMGIETRDASGNIRSTIPVFLEMSDAFKSYANTPEKAALAQEFFTRTSQQMIGLMNKGSAEIRQQTQAARGLTEQELEASRQFSDIQTDMKRIWTELGLALGTAVVPAMKAFFDAIHNDANTSAVWNESLKAVATTIQGLAAGVIWVTTKILNLTDAFASASRAAGILSTAGTIGFGAAWRQAVKEGEDADKRAAARNAASLKVIDSLLRGEKEVTNEKHKQQEAQGGIVAPKALDERKQVAEQLKKLDADRADAELYYQNEILATNDLVQRGAISKQEQFEKDKLAALALAEDLKSVNSEIEKLAKANPNIPELRSKLDQGRQAESQARSKADQPGVNDIAQFSVQLQQMKDEFAVTFQSIATTIRTTISGAIDSVSSNLTAVILKTKSWKAALQDIAVTILTSIINAIIKMALQWVVSQILMATVGKALAAAAVAANIPIAVSLSAVWAAPATLATIASYGGAAAAAPAAIAAAQAVTLGESAIQLAEGGYITGGTPGKDSVAAWLMPEEFVIPRPIVRAFGAAYFEEYRQGRIPERGRKISGTPAPNRTGYFASGGSVAAPASRGSSDTNVSVAFVNDRQSLREWMSTDGYKIIADQHTRRSNKVNS